MAILNCTDGLFQDQVFARYRKVEHIKEEGEIDERFPFELVKSKQGLN